MASTSAETESPCAVKPARKPVPVAPVWSDAVLTPAAERSSASHSAPTVQVSPFHGVAVTGVVPAFWSTVRFCAVKAPESTLYRRVTLLVVRVSQPSEVLEVYGVLVKESRPMALKVGLSVNCPSPAYSVRISVGDSTSNRASPDVTVGMRGWAVPCADAACPVPVSTVAAAAAAATTAIRRRTQIARRRDLAALIGSRSAGRRRRRSPGAPGSRRPGGR